MVVPREARDRAAWCSSELPLFGIGSTSDTGEEYSSRRSRLFGTGESQGSIRKSIECFLARRGGEIGGSMDILEASAEGKEVRKRTLIYG